MAITKKEIKFGCPYTAKKLKAEVIQTKDKIQILDPSKIMIPCHDSHRLSIRVEKSASKSDIRQAIVEKSQKHFDEKVAEFKKLPNTKAIWSDVHKDYMSWFNKRLNTRRHTVSTRDTYERNGRIHVYDTALGTAPIGDIDEIDLINYYDDLHEKFLMDGLGADLFLHVTTVVKKVFEHAITKRFIIDNPYSQRVKDKANDIRKQLEEEDVSVAKDIDVPMVINFVDFIREKSKADKQYIDLANYMLVTFHLATRSAETSGIYLDDIDFENKEIHIQRQTFKQYGSNYTDSTKEVVTKTLKTKAGNRVIPLSDDLINLFKKIDIDYREGILIPDAQGNKPLWQYPTGVPSVFRGKLRTFLRNYGAEFKARFGKVYNHLFHALRHAGISTWLRAGIDLHRVMKMAGHSNIQTTVNTYGHQAKANDYFNMSDLIKGVKSLTSDLLSNNRQLQE